MAMSFPALLFERSFLLLQDIFPKADPDFLKNSLSHIHNDADLNNFIVGLLEKQKYPTKMDAMKRKLKEKNLMEINMNNIEKFCAEFPNATEHFQKNKVAVPQILFRYIECRFANIFPRHRISFINKTLFNNSDSIVNAFLKLSKTRPTMKTIRPQKTVELPELPDILAYKLYFQILTYLENKKEIDQRNEKRGAIQERMVECQCCFESNVPESMIVTCQKGHEFCKTCVKKAGEILMMQQSFTFPCLTDCDSVFNDETMNSVLDKNAIRAWDQKRSLAEIQKAGLDGLEACIHCSFYQLMSPEEKVFDCLNPECLRSTCRKCLKKEHTPYACEENAISEKFFVENKMSEALISTCWKCGLRFIKIDGCNKITCPCGASMCYFCKKPITDYSHFRESTNGVGCPQDVNTVNLHNERVEKAKASATEQLKNRGF